MKRDERITIRLTPDERAHLERCAAVARVETGALIREVSTRWASYWAAERRAEMLTGEAVRMRRRTGT